MALVDVFVFIHTQRPHFGKLAYLAYTYWFSQIS